MRNHFDKVKLWNLQMCPTADDKLVQALVWTKLAQTVSLKAFACSYDINFTLFVDSYTLLCPQIHEVNSIILWFTSFLTLYPIVQLQNYQFALL